MVLRKLTLSEWFLRYQLLKFQKHHFFIPLEIDIDVTSFAKESDRVPMTAVMVKAAALLLKKAPYAHRVMFSTLFGPRMVQATRPIVNLPLAIKHEGREVVTAIMVADADVKSLAEINREIVEALKKPLAEYKIVHFVETKKNHFFHRLLLRGLYFLAYCVPQLYIRRGGGAISVSSLVNHHGPEFNSRPTAYGPTAFTFCFSSFEKRGDKTFLKIGAGYDHTALTGNEAVKALKILTEIVQRELPQAVTPRQDTPTAFVDRSL
jgi:hypothetical protein